MVRLKSGSALALAGLLLGAGPTLPVQAKKQPAPAIGDVVAARQAAFMLSAAAIGPMRQRVEAGGDVAPLAFGAKGLARWAKALPGMFPAGSGAGTRAKPEIWTNRADFDAKAAAYASAAAALAAAAEVNDKAGFAARLKDVQQSCSACHDLYRAEAK